MLKIKVQNVVKEVCNRFLNGKESKTSKLKKNLKLNQKDSTMEIIRWPIHHFANALHSFESHFSLPLRALSLHRFRSLCLHLFLRRERAPRKQKRHWRKIFIRSFIIGEKGKSRRKFCQVYAVLEAKIDDFKRFTGADGTGGCVGANIR